VRRDTSEYANTRLKFQRLKSSPLIKKISKQFLLVSLVDLRALNCLYQISLINSPYSTAAAQKRENIFSQRGMKRVCFYSYCYSPLFLSHHHSFDLTINCKLTVRNSRHITSDNCNLFISSEICYISHSVSGDTHLRLF